jgi:hypothetical protein
MTMETSESAVEIYQFHVWIRQISPMIWRRLLVRSDSSIEDFHHTLQIAFGWSDLHLNLFHIQGQDYGVYHDGGIRFFKNPKLVKLGDFKFRKNERFTYEYDFGDCWEHSVRLEARLPLDKDKTYPRCIDGRRRAPPEDCGGPIAFMARREEIPMLEFELLQDIEESLRIHDMVGIRARIEDISELQEWLDLDKFDRLAVNHQLKQFSANDPAWQLG